MIIGIDDTDSKNGMCTTYLAAVLIEELKKYGTVQGYPLLVRLNPTIPYKTRGNAAIAIPLELNSSSDAEHVEELVIKAIEQMAVLSDENTNPGVVFLEEDSSYLKDELARFSLRAVQDVLEIQEALDFLNCNRISHRGFKNKRGLIGALAAAGFALTGLPDVTYELIAYRERTKWGTPREINEDSVWETDDATYPETWDTVDHVNKRVVFAPHSPDPILFGIRGNSEKTVRRAFSNIRSEPVERHVVYRTNQNTDMHLIHGRIGQTKDHRSYIIDGEVSKAPRAIKGGHVFFEIADNGARLECAAFEPTKGFRDIIRMLCIGDEVTVFGSVKERTLNLEKIRIISLQHQVFRNPLCCNKRMKSMGRRQGYRCEKCGAVEQEPQKEALQRYLAPGFYEVPPSARRHLSKPLIRYYTTMNECVSLWNAILSPCLK